MDTNKKYTATEYYWYKELFNQSERKIMSEDKIDEIIRKSIQCAENLYNDLFWELTKTDLETLIKSYGVNIIFNNHQDAKQLIAAYDNKAKSLELFSSAIKDLKDRVTKNRFSRHFEENTIDHLILSHELYHIIEMSDENLYTYEKMIDKHFVFLKWSSRAKTASEIGAYHFSKLVTKCDFSPRVIEKIYLNGN